jgi:branched-chain amino acid transport system substrate-binding protein
LANCNLSIRNLNDPVLKKIALFYLLIFCSFGCSTAPTGNGPNRETPNSPTPVHNEQQEYHVIEELFSQGALEASALKASAFSKRYPHSDFTASLENIRGLVSLKHKKYRQAEAHFKKSLSLSQDNHAFQQYVYFNLATTLADSNKIEAALQSLSTIDMQALDKQNRVKVAYLKASIYDKKSLPLEASRQLLTLGDLLNDAEWQRNQGPFFKLLEESLQKINDSLALEKLLHEFENSPIADSILYRLGSLAISTGNSNNSELYLKTLLLKYPQSSYYTSASQLLVHPQEHQNPLEGNTVGVLLPMKGKFSKFGAKSLQGIELAFGIFDPAEHESKISLVVEDSGDDGEQAVQALDRLVTKHHVVAVIGPMLSKGVDQVTQRAQELGVPLISLARKTTPSQDFVFQGGLTQQLQAYEIARHAIQELGLKKLAILYPNDKFGTEMSQYFWDSVESLGGKIVAAESYPPGETDFRKSVDRLSGLFYLDARQRELDLLAEERESNNIKKRTRKTEQFFNLKPIVDYEAVFIPDEPKVAGQILPTFLYRDVDHIKFLGTSSWNSPEFLTRAQNYADKSSFVDAFFADSKKPSIVDFLKKYRSTFGQEPTALEILAYDAALVLKSTLLSPAQFFTRTEIRDRLKAIKDFPGATGQISFKDGQLSKELLVITVKNGQFTEQ